MASRRIVLVMLEPPAAPGRAVGAWYAVLLRQLVARGHRVTAFAACSDPADIPHARRQFPAPEYDLRCYPFPAGRGLGARVGSLLRPQSYPFSDDLRRDLQRELAHGYDVLHLEQLSCGWLAPADTSRALVNVHYLHALDLPDRPPPGLRSWADWHRLREAERRLLRRFRHLRVLSERMATTVRTIHPAAQVSVGVNGLDPSDYPYLPDDQRPTEPTVGVIGNMHWPPSRTAAERLLTRLWPAVRERVPGTRATVVGWGAGQHFARFADAPGVSVVGDAAEVRSHFERLGVLLYAPGRGSGTKVKVLEALGYGVPVVTNAEGAEGLALVDGVHAGVCDDDTGLIDRAARLLTDPTRANRQRAAGRAHLEATCGPRPTVDAVEATYRRLSGGDAG